MQIDEELTIEPTELVAGGAALAKIDGYPIFAFNIFPGDVARVRILEAKKGYARAELIELEKPSPLRRVAPCPIAEECGGCDWAALRLDAALGGEKRVLLGSLRRNGEIYDPPPVPIHPSPLDYSFRLRVHPRGGKVGLFAEA